MSEGTKHAAVVPSFVPGAMTSTCASTVVSVRASVAPRAKNARRSFAVSAASSRDDRVEATPGGPLEGLRKAFAATAAAAVLIAAGPDAALANAFDGDLSPTNGPLKSLPKGARPVAPCISVQLRDAFATTRRPPRDRDPSLRLTSPRDPPIAELTEPDEIFREDFTVKFAGIEVDHKYLVGALILGQGIGFLGSLIGGNEARKKGEQVRELNASLLKVNAELRREMREAGVGPYVPIPAQRFIERIPGSTDEDDAAADAIVLRLKTAKRTLSEGDDAEALALFEEARQMIDENPVGLREAWKASRKAHRGMGAALERLGRFEEALREMETVLSLSETHDDHSGQTDALGVIADIYTDMDRLEEAAEYYDKYFTSLQEEDARNAAATPAR